MFLGIFSSLASYIELTITGPVRVLAEHERPVLTRRKRERKDSSAKPFSLFALMQKQRLMSSPETRDIDIHGSPRELYLDHPHTTRWPH